MGSCDLATQSAVCIRHLIETSDIRIIRSRTHQPLSLLGELDPSKYLRTYAAGLACSRAITR